VAKVGFSENVKPEHFMHSKQSEKKFLKGSVGHKMRLRFWKKRHARMTELLLAHLASYRHVPAREFEYQL